MLISLSNHSLDFMIPAPPSPLLCPLCPLLEFFSHSCRYGLPPERLWISVFEDDDEAFLLWHNEVSCLNDSFSDVSIHMVHPFIIKAWFAWKTKNYAQYIYQKQLLLKLGMEQFFHQNKVNFSLRMLYFSFYHHCYRVEIFAFLLIQLDNLN